MIKLIVLDIDGTLVNSQKEIPASFWEVFEQLDARGVQFCIASGRQVQGLQQLFAPIKDRLAFIPDNGASAICRGKELYEDPVDYARFVPIIEVCEAIEGVSVGLCCKRYTYIKTDSEAIFQEYPKYYPAHKRVDNFDGITDTVFKLAICTDRDIRTHLYPHLERFTKDFNVAISGAVWLDVMKKETNKGEAVAQLQKALGIGYEETAVFGDQLNDLEMMGVAAYSFAMKNGAVEVKAAAQYTTEFDNDHEGVVREIERLMREGLFGD